MEAFYPKVSILIPTYNQPQYIHQAVKSALGQDYQNLQVVVSDDSINNDTAEMLKPYLTDSRFYYSRNEKNIGRVANYRKLLYELAKGEWVVMLDGDDYYIDTSYISKAMSIIKKDPSIVLVGAGHQVYNEHKNETIIHKLVSDDIIFDGNDVFMKKLNLPQHSTDIYLRSLACELDFYRHPSAGSDSESLFRLCLYGKVAYLTDVPVVWRIHKANATYIRDFKTQMKDLQFIESVYKYALPFVDLKILKKWRFNLYKGMSYHLIDSAVLSKKFKNIIKVVSWVLPYWGIRESSIFLVKYVYRSLKSPSKKKSA